MKLTISSTVMQLFLNFSSAFTKPTYQNFIVLCVGAVISNGAKTVTNILRGVKPLVKKDFSAYHHFFSRANMNMFVLSKMLCQLVLKLLSDNVELVVDETITRHSGAKVYGKSTQRDKIRSTKKVTVYTYGHYWIVLCINVHMPYLTRPWALPIMALLKLSKKEAAKYNVKHRTPIQLTMIMLKKLAIWFPHKTFTLSGDGGFASVELTKFCNKHTQIELVSRLRKDAVLYDFVKKQKKKSKGRPSLKGNRILSPEKEVARKSSHSKKWKRTTIKWYGGTTKDVECFYNTALLYQPSKGVVPVCYVIVYNKQDDNFETFFTTDKSLCVEEIIRLFVERWSIEVTFEEARKFLSIESTRNRKKESVTRSFPFLICLFSFISVWYFQNVSDVKSSTQQEDWYKKDEPTFSDAITSLRLELWQKNIFSMSDKNDDIVKIDRPFVRFIVNSLSRAA